MEIYSVENRFCATLYILAENLAGAISKFEAIHTKTINALDRNWFSEAPFGSSWMPELSLATAFTSYGASENAVLSSVTEKSVRRAMKPDMKGDKCRVLPSVDADGFDGRRMNVYWCDVEIVSAVFFRTTSDAEAVAKLSDLTGGVDLEYTRTWLYAEALDDTYFPYALSPKFQIVGAWEGWELELRWSPSAMVAETI